MSFGAQPGAPGFHTYPQNGASTFPSQSEVGQEAKLVQNFNIPPKRPIDWENLVRFYCRVFNRERVGPAAAVTVNELETNITGQVLSQTILRGQGETKYMLDYTFAKLT